MNRNILKIIAIVSMVIDHVGLYLFENNIWLRIVGRLAFPIFAFFIAEGMRYTRNRKKYILTLLIFAIISQIPYSFLQDVFHLNVLFTFLIAIGLILLIESKEKQMLCSVLIALVSTISFVLGLFGVIDYGLFGIALVLTFYFVKQKSLKNLLAVLIFSLLTLMQILLYGFHFINLISIFAVLSLILLNFYNGNKGRINLKYMFYIFYPAHLLIILMILIL